MLSFNKTLIEYGVEKLRFFVPLKKSGLCFDNTESWQECYISEHRYKIIDNYKIMLIPVNQNYCSRDYYIEDFESLLQNGFIIQKTGIDQHAEDVIWYTMLGNVQVVHKANVLK